MCLPICVCKNAILIRIKQLLAVKTKSMLAVSYSLTELASVWFGTE